MLPSIVSDDPDRAYDDAYATCHECYATLRVYDVESGEVTRILGVSPTSQQMPGERPHGAAVRHHGWFLSSEHVVPSRDVRRHIDWLLDQLIDHADGVHALGARGGRLDISCYWVSEHGHGGPMISPAQSAKLAALGIELWFDVYFHHHD